MLDVQQNILLAPFTTFGVGGPADFFVIVHSAQELEDALLYAKEKNLQFFVLGSGANILVGDKGFRGLVIKNEARLTIIKEENERTILTAESGTVIADLIVLTQGKGLSGLEYYAGIPSTLGGALWQNLHFLSPDRQSTMFIGDIVESAVILSVSEKSFQQSSRNEDSSVSPQNDKIKTVGKDYFKFAYDYSSLHDSTDIVLSASLLLTPENPTTLKERIDANVLWRKEKHPENAVHSSAGSVFKKIEGFGAGRLIEKVGLKGKQIGGAKISEKHANFIINTGTATAQDVRELIALIQETVKNQLQLDLKTEISFIGEF